MASEKIKTAIVGLGHIGRRHLESVSSLDEFEIVAVCESNFGLKMESKFDGIPRFVNLKTMLKTQPEIELVAICTPNGLHAKQAIEVLKSGRHVLIEKPMALNSREGELIISIAKEFGKQVFVVMQLRFSPALFWLKKQLTDKQLGEIRLIETRCFWNRDERYYSPNGQPHEWRGSQQLDGGVIFTQFSHFVDAIHWLFGPVARVLAANHRQFSGATPGKMADTGLVQFETTAGALGSFSYSTAVPERNLESSLLVIGSKGTVKIGGQYLNEISATGPVADNLPVKTDNPTSINLHKNFYQHTASVLNEKSSPVSPASDALEVIKLIEKMVTRHKKLTHGFNRGQLIK